MVPNQLIQDPDKLPMRQVTEVTLRVDNSSEEKVLNAGFTKLESKEGLKVLGKLSKEYSSLSLILTSSSIEGSVIDPKRISKLTTKLYQQGLGLLTRVLSTIQQLDITGVDDLLAEYSELEAELGRHEVGSTMHTMISERLERNSSSIKLVKGSRDTLDEFFMEVGLCIDSIREIRLGLPGLVGSRPRDEFDKAMLELRTRIEFASRVQAEYKKQGL